MKLPVVTESRNGNGNGLCDDDDDERKVAIRTCKTSKSELMLHFNNPLSGYIINKVKHKHVLLPSNEYKESACRGIHHTCIHSDAFKQNGIY